jgi:hypothetical protein
MHELRSQWLAKSHKLPRGEFSEAMRQFGWQTRLSGSQNVNERPLASLTIDILHIIMGFATSLFIICNGRPVIGNPYPHVYFVSKVRIDPFIAAPMPKRTENVKL